MQTTHKKVQSLSTDNAFISSLKLPTLVSFSGRISLVRSICNSDHPHADLFCFLATNLKREILVRRESSLVCLHVIIVSITSLKREILVRREQYSAPRGDSVMYEAQQISGAARQNSDSFYHFSGISHLNMAKTRINIDKLQRTTEKLRRIEEAQGPERECYLISPYVIIVSLR